MVLQLAQINHVTKLKYREDYKKGNGSMTKRPNGEVPKDITSPTHGTVAEEVGHKEIKEVVSISLSSDDDEEYGKENVGKGGKVVW